MQKVIAAINITLDGFCNHTAMIADQEIHQHYNELLRNADTILYGRITYQLMEYWPTVFSHTLKNLEWKNARFAKRGIKEEILELKQSRNGEAKPILVGSRSLITALLNLNLIDEFQLCVQPIIAGKGLPLLDNINDRINLKLLKTKTFGCGAVTFYYEPTKR